MSKYKDFQDDYEEEDSYPRPVNPVRLIGAIMLGFMAWYMFTNATSPTPPAVVDSPTPYPTAYPTPEPVVVVVTATPDLLAMELAQSVERIKSNEVTLATSIARVDSVATEVAAVTVLVASSEERLTQQEQKLAMNETTSWYIQLIIFVLAMCIVGLSFVFLRVNSSPTPYYTTTPTPSPYSVGLAPEPSPFPEVAPPAPQNRFGTVLETVQSSNIAPLVLRPNTGRYFEAMGPLSEEEKARIISSYSRFQSKTAVCKAVYGYKNSVTLARVSQVIRPE